MNKISLGAFIGMTMALCATVRSIPTLAAAGWLQITYLLFSIICFAWPVTAIAGELSTMLPGEGGPQLWVKEGLGERWGMVTAWLLWTMMFAGMVMVATGLWPMLCNAFGRPDLSGDTIYSMVCIFVLYWVITILNLKFNMAKFGGNIGVWLGVYIPVVILFVMGLATSIKIGLNPAGYLGAFSFDKLIPNVADMSSLKYLVSIAFIFTGIEISSVYIPQLEDATNNYPKGLMASLIGLVVLNIANGLLVANIVPEGTLELANIAQPILIECKILGLPTIIANIFAFMVFLGVLLQLSAWVTGPARAMTQVAKEGLLPASWGFHKVNKFGVSTTVVLVQSVFISLFTLLYVIIGDVNAVFLVLTNVTAIVYSISYILVAIVIVKLRYARPNDRRPYRIGKSGNGMAILYAILLIGSIVGMTSATLMTTALFDRMIIIGISIVLFIMPLVIYSNRSPSWKKKVDMDLSNLK